MYEICVSGCINIIGEYIDYNMGYVLLVVINKFIFFVGVINGLDYCWVYVVDIDEYDIILFNGEF